MKDRIFTRPYHRQFLGMFQCKECCLPFPAWKTGEPTLYCGTKCMRRGDKRIIKTNPRRKKEDPKKVTARTKRHRKEHPEVRLNGLAKLREEVLELLGGKCAYIDIVTGDVCPVNDYRVLNIDHIWGARKTHRKKLKTNRDSLRKVLRDVKAGRFHYQLLCANHNTLKRYVDKEVRQSKATREMYRRHRGVVVPLVPQPSTMSRTPNHRELSSNRPSISITSLEQHHALSL